MTVSFSFHTFFLLCPLYFFFICLSFRFARHLLQPTSTLCAVIIILWRRHFQRMKHQMSDLVSINQGHRRRRRLRRIGAPSVGFYILWSSNKSSHITKIKICFFSSFLLLILCTSHLWPSNWLLASVSLLLSKLAFWNCYSQIIGTRDQLNAIWMALKFDDELSFWSNAIGQWHSIGRIWRSQNWVTQKKISSQNLIKLEPGYAKIFSSQNLI